MIILSGKKFSEYMAECRKEYLERCMQVNNRDNNTSEEIKLSKQYYPDIQYKRYGYYTYESHTGFYSWTKRKPNIN